MTNRARSSIVYVLKPASIKRTPDGRIMLVDFGIAKVDTDTATVLSAVALTPGYAPLEQYHGGTDERSDIYAVGRHALCAAHRAHTAQRHQPRHRCAAPATADDQRRSQTSCCRRAARNVVLPAGRFQSIESSD